MFSESGLLIDADSNQQLTFEDDKDIPTVDEHLQTAGADAFHRFQKRIDDLDKELRNFSHAARELGGSAAILSSAFQLRTEIAHISFLYHLNAADLYPRKIKPPASARADDMSGMPRNRPKPRRKYHHLSEEHRVLPHVARPTVDTSIDLEDLPNQFEALAEEVTTFVNCLNEFHEFTSISSFEGDLKYWASCLNSYSGLFRYPAVQRYVQDLGVEMGEHIDSITSTLSMFIEVGVPTVRWAQKQSATNSLNLSTVATFLSAVTATTLQFSYQLNNLSGTAVNIFWFLSLVFSIAAAVNSILGLTWKQTIYRSPRHQVPWWVLIWIEHFPLVFLVLSVACFSIGLCLFTYASGQRSIVATITTVFTGFTTFGLAAVSAWFASERWAFTNQKSLGDVLIQVNESFLKLSGIALVGQRLHQSFKWVSRLTPNARTKAQRVRSIAENIISSDGEKVGDIENWLPMTMLSEDENMAPSMMGHRRTSETGASSPLDSPAMSSTMGSATPSSPPNTPSSPTSPSIGKQLWKNAFRTVRTNSGSSSPMGAGPRSPNRQRTASSTLLSSDRKHMMSEAPVKAIVRSRIAALLPKLKCLEPTQDLACHQALVRHLQFSPDGKFLATSSWDRTSVILRVENSCVTHYRTLAHAKGFVGQVAWSPTGHLLLTKRNRDVQVWTQDGVCQRTIDRPAYVESITWFPGGEAFLSVEGSKVAKMDLKGKVLGTYNFEGIKLQSVAVTPDGARLLGVGPLLLSPDGLQPSKSRAEKRLTIYNMNTGQIEHTTPVLNDVKDVTLARNTRNDLVALAPPQLWKLEIVNDIARLTLRHTYMPKSPVDFAGPSYFGGKNDELVLCAGKAGDIHIWDQESGTLLHHLRAQDLGGDLTCIAWNQAEDDPFMFATGSHDGAELESTFANSVENLGTGPSSTFANRERMVAFAAAHTGSPTVDLDTRGRTL
ncbi:WD40 repeat-like protein [Gymnopus androsaceus JB14]|uniref:WD40 repeat-like protein n=1 Tax=Gymnopus androsaceus JB14 TaxID=1447944 RepID=A0A6A4HWE3_9AGAR|nr:WD40 repeat-like protein [Gymnopus androsaceus JB14]